MKSGWCLFLLIPAALLVFGCSDPNGPRLPGDDGDEDKEEDEDGTSLNELLPPGVVLFA